MDLSNTAGDRGRLIQPGRPFTEYPAPALPFGGALVGITWTPKIECRRSNGNLIVSAEVPGLSEDEIKVEVTNEGLILDGERKRKHFDERQRVYRCERSYGHFYRFVPLPEGAKAEEATAELSDGVLTVVVPLPEVKEYRRAIPVKSGKSAF